MAHAWNPQSAKVGKQALWVEWQVLQLGWSIWKNRWCINKRFRTRRDMTFLVISSRFGKKNSKASLCRTRCLRSRVCRPTIIMPIRAKPSAPPASLSLETTVKTSLRLILCCTTSSWQRIEIWGQWSCPKIHIIPKIQICWLKVPARSTAAKEDQNLKFVPRRHKMHRAIRSNSPCSS